MENDDRTDYKALYLELVAELEIERKRDEELKRRTHKNFKEMGEAIRAGTLRDWLTKTPK
jgi:hypothetical protein